MQLRGFIRSITLVNMEALARNFMATICPMHDSGAENVNTAATGAATRNPGTCT
jgi:hypothetical protein